MVRVVLDTSGKYAVSNTNPFAVLNTTDAIYEVFVHNYTGHFMTNFNGDATIHDAPVGQIRRRHHVDSVGQSADGRVVPIYYKQYEEPI